MRYFLLLVSIFLLFACAKKNKKGEGGIGDMLGGLMGGSAGSIGTKAHGSIRPTYDAGYFSAYGLEAGEQARMVNYKGDIRLESSEPEVVIDTVVQRAKDKGGSIDSRKSGFVSFQIPVAEFKDFFNYILTLGRVIRKSISADDITNAYIDNATRLRIAESSLTRLQQLLAVAKTEQEKLALLKEIQRINEQIEQRKLTEKELLHSTEFSTITLSVKNIAQKTKPFKQKIEAFEWLAELPQMFVSGNGSAEELPLLGKPLKLSIPQGFIEAENSEIEWRAASAMNAEFLAFETENDPQGTPDFWANTMLEFFKSEYRTELKSEENFSMVRLQSFNTEPEIYYIAILKKSDKKNLKIAVAKFPSLEVEQKNSEAVKEVLRRAKK
ncbi:MAG: DUF4349 domain-containing protein [Fibromonadaceae bacterium]|jgi:hypothetical protein|nr:DUF4349 domain-containing protein [Fibromonadaceae bacterium]